MMRVFDKTKKKIGRWAVAVRSQDCDNAVQTSSSDPSFKICPPTPSINELFPKNKIYGLRVLRTPSYSEVDIIFLHGLTGRPDRTFLDDKTQTYWPVHLLPQDIPNARILSFGYDADVAKFLGPVGQNTLEDHASDLLNDLARIRDNGSPLSFPWTNFILLKILTIFSPRFLKESSSLPIVWGAW